MLRLVHSTRTELNSSVNSNIGMLLLRTNLGHPSLAEANQYEGKSWRWSMNESCNCMEQLFRSVQYSSCAVSVNTHSLSRFQSCNWVSFLAYEFWCKVTKLHAFQRVCESYTSHFRLINKKHRYPIGISIIWLISYRCGVESIIQASLQCRK